MKNNYFKEALKNEVERLENIANRTEGSGVYSVGAWYHEPKRKLAGLRAPKERSSVFSLIFRMLL